MDQLIHNAIMVPPRYLGQGLTIKVRNKTIHLSDVQEEMALAWVKKIGTPYVEDPVFAENFHKDFSEKLGIKVLPGDVDFSEIYSLIMKEREERGNLSNEEKKRLREQRKLVREANKEKYGYAIIDGEQCEIGNYTAEPSSIFMGRGKHPMRGRWKEGPNQEDIELNLSPDAPIPPGNWKAVVWEPNTIWIARWRDKLSGKMKYVWPHDASPIKQIKDVEKYEKAIDLGENLDRVQQHIELNLLDQDLKRRKTATVCYLIDHLKFRVGDEKVEEDEADTVGASSLRPEHICFNENDTVTFDFLGKDSVRHLISTSLPKNVVSNLQEFAENSNDSTLFDEVNSSNVSEFLDEVMEGLSAKVFRTYYASKAVEGKLEEIELNSEESDYVKKYVATIANLEAALVCNHKRTIPKTWMQSLIRQKQRLEDRKKRMTDNIKKNTGRIKDSKKKYIERIDRYEQKLNEDKQKLEDYKEELRKRIAEGRSTKGIENRIASKKGVIKNQRKRIRDTKQKFRERINKLREQMEIRRKKDMELIEKAKLQIEVKELTKDFNLNTSLKSYIDPRIYFEWGKKIGYNWKNYYSNTLSKKFSWVEQEEEE